MTASDDSVERDTTGANEQRLVDPDFTGDVESVRAHYDRASPVFDALATVGDAVTTGFAGNTGWYRYRDETDPNAIEEGWTVRARCYTFERDRRLICADITERNDDDSWRSLYNVTTWKDSSAVYREVRREGRGPTDVWDGGEANKPTPEYADIVGLPLWIDVDLADDVSRSRGQLADEQCGTLERAFEHYIDAVADLYGVDPAAVPAFDSGGGAYIYGFPAATAPIHEAFADDRDARERIFEALNTRLNDYASGGDSDIEGITPRVFDQVSGAADLLDPDHVNNKNRQSKAPLSIHGSHDVVVTPLRNADGEIDYTPTLVSDVDDALIDRTVAEVDRLTDTRWRELTGNLVARLFPQYVVDADDWYETLTRFVYDSRGAEWITAIERDRARDVHAARLDELANEGDGLQAVDTLRGVPIVSDRRLVIEAAESIPVEDVVRDHASDAFDTTARARETSFDPSWRDSDSGSSCYIKHDGRNLFGDNACNGGGGPVKALALGLGILSGPDAAARTLDGRDYLDAVDALRAEYGDIPVYVPERGSTRADDTEYDETPHWGVVKAALALGVCDEDDLVERDGDDGGTYQGIPTADVYNTVLDRLDDLEYDHNRERATADSTPGPGDSETEGAVTSLEPPADSWVELDTKNRPCYSLDGIDEGLHLRPASGGKVRFIMRDSDGRTCGADTRDWGKWESKTVRKQLTNGLAEDAGLETSAEKDALREALAEVARNAMDHREWFDAAMRTVTERTLRIRTSRVVTYPSEADDETDFRITLTPPSDSPVVGERTITLNAGQFNDHNAAAFANKHLSTFLAECDPDADEWQSLREYWLHVQEVESTEADHAVQAAVEEFVATINLATVMVADEANIDRWPEGKSNMLYLRNDTEFERDVLLARGKWVVQWKREHGFEDVNLCRELRDRDIMLETTIQRQYGESDAKISLWPLAPSQFNHSPETARPLDVDAPSGAAVGVGDENSETPDVLR